MKRSNYLPSDSQLSVQYAPYLQISDRSLQGLISRTERDGQNYQKFLPLYPAVCCEYLEFHYHCRRALDMLDQYLLEDLLFSFSWREANWGAWLAMLGPQVGFADLILKKQAEMPDSQLIIALAFAANGGEIAPALTKLHQRAENLRQLMQLMPSQRLPLRPNFTLRQDELANQEIKQIRGVFRQYGFDKARARMQEGLVGYFMLSHREWLARGAPPASDFE